MFDQQSALHARDIPFGAQAWQHDARPAQRDVATRCRELPRRVNVARVNAPLIDAPLIEASLAQLIGELPLKRRVVQPRQYVFEAGQPRQALLLVHAGCVKTTVTSADGREQITSFRMRGDVLGLDSLDLSTYACNAIALDISEVWELPHAQLRDAAAHVQRALNTALARELRRDGRWMLVQGTLAAEQRVATFLLDLSARMSMMGFSAHCLMLRMTRAEIGNYLAIKLETVTRALGRLQARGLIAVHGREIRIEDAAGLRSTLEATTRS